MDYAVATPNHGLVNKHDEMNRILFEKLSFTPIRKWQFKMTEMHV